MESHTFAEPSGFLKYHQELDQTESDSLADKAQKSRV